MEKKYLKCFTSARLEITFYLLCVKEGLQLLFLVVNCIDYFFKLNPKTGEKISPSTIQRRCLEQKYSGHFTWNKPLISTTNQTATLVKKKVHGWATKRWKFNGQSTWVFCWAKPIYLRLWGNKNVLRVQNRTGYAILIHLAAFKMRIINVQLCFIIHYFCKCVVCLPLSVSNTEKSEVKQTDYH